MSLPAPNPQRAHYPAQLVLSLQSSAERVLPLPLPLPLPNSTGAGHGGGLAPAMDSASKAASTVHIEAGVVCGAGGCDGATVPSEASCGVAPKAAASKGKVSAKAKTEARAAGQPITMETNKDGEPFFMVRGVHMVALCGWHGRVCVRGVYAERVVA
jgi:hypothetical protein